MNIYELEVQTACPVHEGQLDLYTVTVRSHTMIPVEDILSFFARYRGEKIYQEDLTQRAATALGAHVEMAGIHSGVTVRSTAP